MRLHPPASTSLTVDADSWSTESMLSAPFTAGGHKFILEVKPNATPEFCGAYLRLGEHAIGTEGRRIVGPKAVLAFTTSSGIVKHTDHIYTKDVSDWGFKCMVERPDDEAPITITVSVEEVTDTTVDLTATISIPANLAACSFSSFFQSLDLADCTICTPGAVDRRAHRFVLAAHSPVLRATFTNVMLEGTTSTITVNSDPQLVDHMLRYMYGQPLPNIPVQQLLPLMQLADFYGHVKLYDATSSRFLQQAFNKEALAQLLPQATLLGLSAIADKLMKDIISLAGFWQGPADAQMLVRWTMDDMALMVRHAKGSFKALKVLCGWLDLCSTPQPQDDVMKVVRLANLKGMRRAELAKVRRMPALRNVSGLRELLLDVWEGGIDEDAATHHASASRPKRQRI